MNPETAKRLCALNNAFYRDNSGSFSETRQSPWPGWTRCLEVLRAQGGLPDDRRAGGRRAGGRQSLSILDLACGNLRFERFLASALPDAALAFHAVDNCDSLASPMPGAKNRRLDWSTDRRLTYQSLDILDTLHSGLCLNDRLAAPLCDLAVSFGFLHHVPLREYREKVLASLVRQTRPGGFVIVSLWQFLNDEALAQRAQATREHALQELGLPALDDNDCLLGWKNLPGTYRYCHHFSELEIDRLVESIAPVATARTTSAPSASLLARFTSDGRTGDLNTYLVMRVSCP